MESTIKYRFAYDENDCVVKIDEITENDRENHKYHCISCGNEMIAKLGIKNVHHFAHKMDCSCNGETYLHKLAKKLIKKKFDESEEFNIYLKQRTICKKEGECKFFSSDECWDIIYKKIDLKEYYNKCQEEEPIKDNNGNKYIADLLLSHTEKSNRNPLLIEFVVSHKCSEEKLKSKLRIIEISIEKENDIINLYNSEAWEYNVQNKYHNFKKEVRKEDILEKKELTRLVLCKNGLIRVDNERMKCSCMKNKKSLDVKAEIYISEFNAVRSKKEFSIASFVKLGYLVKSCVLCEYHKKSTGICSVSKSKGTPIKPKWDYGNSCCYFSESKTKLEEIIHSIQGIKIAEVK